MNPPPSSWADYAEELHRENDLREERLRESALRETSAILEAVSRGRTRTLPKTIGCVEMEDARKVAEEFEAERQDEEEKAVEIAADGAEADQGQRDEAAQKFVENGKPTGAQEDAEIPRVDNALSKGPLGLLVQKIECTVADEEVPSNAIQEQEPESRSEDGKRSRMAEAEATRRHAEEPAAKEAMDELLVERSGCLPGVAELAARRHAEKNWQRVDFKHMFRGSTEAHTPRPLNVSCDAPVCGGA